MQPTPGSVFVSIINPVRKTEGDQGYKRENVPFVLCKCGYENPEHHRYNGKQPDNNKKKENRLPAIIQVKKPE